MKGMIRVVLVDPLDESRQSLQRLLGGIESVWLVEACASYPEAERSVGENAPDLTIVVADADPERAVGLIQAILRSRPEAVVLPAGRGRDADLILRCVRAGAREFLPLPAELDELLRSIDRLLHPNEGSGSGGRRGSRVIALAGATGGVGCTTLAINLAATLAKDPEQSVALADFDLLLGAVDTCLDILPDHTILEVAQSVDRLDLVLLKRSLTRHESGLYILPHPVSMEDVAQIDPEALRRVVGLLKAAFTSVVIDTSKGLQATDFVAFELADVILLVVQLDLICLRNTARLLQLLRQMDGLIDRVRVVVNRTGSNYCEISMKKAEETLSLPISWQVPDAYKICTAARSRGILLETEAPGSRAHRSIQTIARALIPPASPDPTTDQTRPRWGRIAALFC